MDLSQPGLLGAMLGTIVGVLNYLVFLRIFVPRLRATDKSQTGEERDEFERKISLLRRIILSLDVVVFAALGYWLGRTVGG
jgi:hypothetical protein